MNIVLLAGVLIGVDKSVTKTGWFIQKYKLQIDETQIVEINKFSKQEEQVPVSNGDWVLAQCKLSIKTQTSKAGYEFQRIDLSLLKIKKMMFNENPLMQPSFEDDVP